VSRDENGQMDVWC